MNSPTKGSVSTPHWDEMVQNVFAMNTKVMLTVPADHHMMFNVLHIHLRKPKKALAHKYGVRPVSYCLKCKKTAFVGLYERSATDPFKVFCGTRIPSPSAYAPRSSLIYVRFVHEVKESVHPRYQKIIFFKGFKLYFSFHPHSTMLKQIPPQDGKWNCSVPQWHEFSHHFPCNLQAECLGREDEAACPYTTPKCGEGRVTLMGRCFAFTTATPMVYNSTFSPLCVPKPSMTWAKAEEWCQSEGGHLASIHNHKEKTRVIDLLSTYRGDPIVFFGLVPPMASSHRFYKDRWMFLNGVINHFLDTPTTQSSFLRMKVSGGTLIDIESEKVEFTENDRPQPFASCLCDMPSSISPETSQPIIPHLPAKQDRYFKNDNSYLECPDGHVTHTFSACDLQSACWSSEVFSPSFSSCLAPVTPLPPQMVCDDSLLHVSYSMVCDYRPDCIDSSDENFCVYEPCDLAKQYQCKDKSCVPLSKMCNLVADCRDSSDEDDCYDIFDRPLPSLPCILIPHYDGSLREVQVKQILRVNEMIVNGTLVGASIADTQIYGAQKLLLSPVIDTQLVLNKILSGAKLIQGTLINKDSPPGNKTQFTEIRHQSIDGGILVSGIVTEVYTSPYGRFAMSNVTITSGTVPCTDTHFQCTADYCIPVFMRCNDVYDCPGREDEAGCDSYQCPGFYRCRGVKACVHKHDLCDGLINCPEADDELLCNLVCPYGCTCYGLAYFCPRVTPVSFDPRLRYLDVSNSSTSYSDVVNNTMLIYLSLVRCDVTGWGPVTLPNLRTLDLRENNVSAVSTLFLRHLPNLRHLTLARNPLMSGFTSDLNTSLLRLRVLDITNVLMTELDLNVLNVFPNLYTLNLSGCGVDSVVGDGFQRLKQLHAVDLRGCPMTFFPRNVFHGLSELRDVHADNYKLCCQATLPSNSLYFVNCEAPTNEVSMCEDLLQSEFLRACLCIFAILSCAGNLSSLVFKTATKSRHRTGFDMFVANLCMSDFLMGIYLTIIGVADRLYMGTYLWNDVIWRHSTVCTVAGFLSLLSSEVSAFIICLITLDRFLVLSFPFSQHLRFNTATACIACALIWATCLVIAAVPLLPGMSQWQFYSQTGICVPLPITRTDFKGRDYTFGVMIVLNFVLFVVVALGQLFIYMSVQKHRMPTTGDASVTSRRKDLKVARRLITVAVSDFLCWFPIGLLGILASNGYHISGEINVAVAIFVLPLNSAINPFLYTINIMLEKVNQSREKRMHQYWLAQMNAQGAGSGNVSRLGSSCTQDEARAILNMWLNKGVLSHEHLSLSVMEDDALPVTRSTNKSQ